MPIGTLTTDGTEQTILSGEPINAPGDIEGAVDLSNMTSSETVIIRIKKAVDGTNDRILEEKEFVGLQDAPGIVFGPVEGEPNDAPISLTVELTAGNNIDIPWEYQRVY